MKPSAQWNENLHISREGNFIGAFGVTWMPRAPFVLPFCCWIRWIEWVLELDDLSTFLTKLTLVLSVVLHQLCQSRKLLARIQVIVVACILYLYVCYFPVPSGMTETKLHAKGVHTISSDKSAQKHFGLLTRSSWILLHSKNGKRNAQTVAYVSQ